MIVDVESGEVGTVIVKDMSRFGRDYLKVGYYTEIMFSELDVHFIAINDGVDSERQGNDFTPIRNLFNEFYAKDTSRKIRAVWKAKGKAGERIASVPVYGYKKDPLDPKHLSLMKKLHRQFSEFIRCAYREWGRIRLPQYYPMKKCFVPRTTLIIQVCAAEQIITQDEWDAVQKIRSIKRRRNNSEKTNMFSGLLYCAECGGRLNYNYKPIKPGQSYFQCGTYSHHATMDDCTTHYIRETVISELILVELNEIICTANCDEKALVELLSKNNETASRKQSAKQKKELAVAQKRYDELDRMFNRLYEDNVNGKISDERFAKMSASYEAEQAEFANTIKNISKCVNDDKTEQDNIRRFVAVAKKYTEITELSTEILHDFIQKIVVHAPDKSSDRRVVQLDIYYNFIGKINE